MKRNFLMAARVATLFLCLFIFSCKKNSSSSGPSERAQIVTGSWKQTDIVLGVPVSVNVGGNDYSFPVGTSVITNPYFAYFGVSALFAPTVNNIYNFSDSGTYNFNGATSLILPNAGSSGKWSLDVYDAVLKLNPSDSVNDPHWIDGIATDSLALSITVTIPGLGTAPLTLILQKEQ